MSEYEKMSLVELRIAAKKAGIKNVTTFKKKELLDKLIELEKSPVNEQNSVVSEEVQEKKNIKSSKNTVRQKRTSEKKKENNSLAKQNENKQNESDNEDNVRENTSYRTSLQEKKSMSEPDEMSQLDSGEVREGILEVMQEGYGFIRCDNYLPGERDVYVSPALIRKYHLRTGDILKGNVRVRNQNEKFGALLYIRTVNGVSPDRIINRVKFEQLTPIFLMKESGLRQMKAAFRCV